MASDGREQAVDDEPYCSNCNDAHSLEQSCSDNAKRYEPPQEQSLCPYCVFKLADPCPTHGKGREQTEAGRSPSTSSVEQLRRELDASNEHLAGLLRRSITHQSDRDALKERKNARIRELLAEVEHLTAENESWKAMTEPMGSGDGQAILAGRSAAVTAEGREQKADRMFAAAKDEQAKQRERSGPTMIDSPGRMQAWTPSEVGFVTDPAPVVSDDPTEEREQTAAERAVEAFASEVEQRPWTPQEHTVYAMGYEAVEHARIHVNCLRCEEPFYYDSWGDESGQRHRTYLPSCDCLGLRRG